MDIKKFKKKLNKLSKKVGKDIVMPIIPALDDYSELYKKIKQNVTEKLDDDFLESIDRAERYAKKYAEEMDQEFLESIDKAERYAKKYAEEMDQEFLESIDKAEKYANEYMEKMEEQPDLDEICKVCDKLLELKRVAINKKYRYTVTVYFNNLDTLEDKINILKAAEKYAKNLES